MAKSNKTTRSPTWLGPKGKRQFQRLIKSLPPLSAQQEDLVALAADAWETYITAGEELQRYASKSRSVCEPNSSGVLQPHGAWRVQTDARNAYRQLIAQLGRTINTQASDEEEDAIDNLASKIEELL